MSLDTSPYLFYARVDPRRRTHAVGMYTHVLDQHGIVYNQPIVLNGDVVVDEMKAPSPVPA